MKKFLIIVVLAFCNVSHSVAQSVNYDKAMDDIMSSHLDDYPNATIKALNALFDGVDIDKLPAETNFFYHYYYGMCLSEDNQIDDAIWHLTKARTIANSNYEVGIRNVYALDVEGRLVDLYMSQDTEEGRATALLLCNDLIAVGISLIENPGIGLFVVRALVEEAKAGVDMWKDPEWVKKIWIQARDLAIEINDSTAYSYYILGVLKYYCDIEEYDTAISFMEDAKNKEILELDATAYYNWINETKNYITQRETLKTLKGVYSLDYWDNELEIATRATVLCSKNVAITKLQEVENGLKQNNLSESYQYAQVIMLLANIMIDDAVIAEQYFLEQVKILNHTPQYFIYMTDVEAYNSLGVCQMRLGKYSEADVNFKKALACLEQDAVDADLPGYKNILAIVCHNMGRNLYFLKDYHSSIDFLQKAISLQENITGSASPKTKIYMSESLKFISRN